MSQTAIEALQSVIGWSTGTGNEKFDRDDAFDRLKCVKEHAEIALSALHAKAGVGVEGLEAIIHPQVLQELECMFAARLKQTKNTRGEPRTNDTIAALRSALSTKLQEPVGEEVRWLCDAPAGVPSSGKIVTSDEYVQKWRDNGWSCKAYVPLAHQPVTAGWNEERAGLIEQAARIAEEDHTPGYGPHKDVIEHIAETQRNSIARRIRSLAVLKSEGRK